MSSAASAAASGDGAEAPMVGRPKANRGSAGKPGPGAPPVFFCYLLQSVNPDFPRSTYIGFTTDPRRRIRQHNGEIGNGAVKTARRRPWEMCCCVWGFPDKVRCRLWAGRTLCFGLGYTCGCGCLILSGRPECGSGFDFACGGIQMDA